MTGVFESAEPSRAVRLYGTEEIGPRSRKLTAGPLTAELENGQLRYVAFKGIEALRGIAFLVRDQNWGTYTPQIDSMWVKEEAGSFTVEYRAVCADANQRLQYAARIIGSNDGGLVFDAVATPETDFVTNRVGFVVLHPAWLAGQKLKVTHVDDREEETRFPERISPSQPVFDIRALSHEAAPGLWATCRMEGDTFEMEDQRNWTDASYKTHVRPLALPWMYTLAKGSRHEQSVRLSLTGGGAAGGAGLSGAIALELGQDLSLRVPYGKGVADNPANGRVCLTNRDPRQRGLFNAAWTLGYVAACAYGGVTSVAMGAATGPLGFVHHRAADGPQPYFDAINGAAVYPAFHVMSGLARGGGHHLVKMKLSEPGKVAALAWREGFQNARLKASVFDPSTFEKAVVSSDALEELRRPL